MDFRHVPDFPVAGRPLRKLDGPMKKDAMNAEKHDLSVCAFYFGAILKQSTRIVTAFSSPPLGGHQSVPFKGINGLGVDLHLNVPRR